MEIIEPTNDAPSPYREALDRAAVVPSAGLFHHFLVDTADFEGTCRRLLDGGALEGLRATLPDGRRMTYIDATAVIGSYVEVIEGGSASAAVSARMREECAEWDGSDPVRFYYDLVARAMHTDVETPSDRAGGACHAMDDSRCLPGAAIRAGATPASYRRANGNNGLSRKPRCMMLIRRS